jgi:glucosamine 6-phosphate synthetase-like amidotransferase/phosphosugar isomerase protein
MCGIAGFSFAPGAGPEPTAVARVLLAGLAERGRDATGYGYRAPGGPIEIVKDSLPLIRLIERVDLPAEASEVIVHVREFTKGIPAVNDNNHPVRWGRVVGVHNGHLENDDDLFERYGVPRSTPHITVDTEAIMMLTDVLGTVGDALTHVRGSAAVAILRDDRPGLLTLGRRTRRPLVIGRADGILLFASTRDALELVARGADLRLEYEEVADGTVIEVEAGEEVSRRRFTVDYRYPGRKLRPYPRLPEKERLVRFALASLGAA